MNTGSDNTGRGSPSVLWQFAPRRRASSELERCELCAAPMASAHQHLLELEKRRLTCVCDPCAILFSGNARQRYRRVPREIVRLRDFQLDDHQWDSLLIPIQLAFFIYNSAVGRVVAQYPSPGGAVESSLDLEYWDAIVARNPVLTKLEPDVQALLVNRISDVAQYYLAPIDHCYRLVGIIRKHWRGLSGGSEVWKEIEKLFAELNLLAEERCA